MEIKFDHAFNSKSTQGDVYSKLIDVIPKIMEGYNVTIFAYGQTGSGKTHTMFGEGWDSNDKIMLEDI
jgi:DNA replication protein DnaC